MAFRFIFGPIQFSWPVYMSKCAHVYWYSVHTQFSQRQIPIHTHREKLTTDKRKEEEEKRDFS